MVVEKGGWLFAHTRTYYYFFLFFSFRKVFQVNEMNYNLYFELLLKTMDGF